MPEKHFTIAVALAKTLFEERERFVCLLRAAAIAQVESGRPRNIHASPAIISRRALELFVDDALYVIFRDGPAGLENHVRATIDEIVREALDDAPKSVSQ